MADRSSTGDGGIVTGALRLLVETEAGGNTGELQLRQALTDRGWLGGWRVERLFPGDEELDRSFVVSTDAAGPMLPRDAFTLAYALADAPGVANAEPDLPIEQFPFEEEAAPVGAFDVPPTADQLALGRTAIRAADAWELPPAGAGGRQRGAGIRIGHPDTGYSRHPAFGADLEALNLVHDWDFVDDDDDARDPIRSSFIPLARFPAHGTGTGSVIVGRGPAATGVVGVAPEATLLPLRAVNSVVQVLDSDVARSVHHAREAGCDIVSMSLGGKGFRGLQRAIAQAVDAGVIVLAAAGNYVRLVTAPARYPECIAVAATDPAGVPWRHSSRGRRVDISAPGAGVYGAAWKLDADPMVEGATVKAGTSYAVAHVAGVAALWLAHHGRDALRQRYPGRLLPLAFRYVLRHHGYRTPQIGGGWDSGRFGPGLVDAVAVLTAPLPAASAVRPPVGAFEVAGEPSGVERIAAAFADLDDDDVAQRLDAAGLPADRVDRVAAEILYNLFTDPASADAFVEADPAAAGAFAPAWVGRLGVNGSPVLKAALGA
jgi:hypothetical protein